MAKFTPIDCGLPIRQSRCELISLDYSPDTLAAIFSTPDGLVVKVHLDGVVGYRTLDETVYSIYGEKIDEGMTPGGFAYTVEGSTFFPNLSDLALLFPSLQHYAFISLSTCVDVLSLEAPLFEVIGEDASAVRHD